MKRTNKKDYGLHKYFAGAALFFILLAVLLMYYREPEAVCLYSKTHTVSAGETLWGICAEYKPEGMDMRRYVDMCREASDIADIIYPGDTVIVFTEVQK